MTCPQRRTESHAKKLVKLTMSLKQYYSDVLLRTGWEDHGKKSTKDEHTRPVIGPEDFFSVILVLVNSILFFVVPILSPSSAIDLPSFYITSFIVTVNLFSVGVLKIRSYEQSEISKGRYWLGLAQIFFIWASGVCMGAYLFLEAS